MYCSYLLKPNDLGQFSPQSFSLDTSLKSLFDESLILDACFFFFFFERTLNFCHLSTPLLVMAAWESQVLSDLWL